eukprot:scaffold169315_cov22-Prasinocladus_malaysianus.AAC.1
MIVVSEVRRTLTELVGGVGQVDDFVAALAQLEELVQNKTLAQLTGNLTQLLSSTTTLVNVTVPAAVSAANSALGVADSAAKCVQLAFNKFQEVNNSVAE